MRFRLALVPLASLFFLVTSLSAQWNVDAFNPGANGQVDEITIQSDGRILVGGEFIGLGGGTGQLFTRYHLGRLNTDGTVDPSFDPGANAAVLAITRQFDDRILIGGSFTLVGGGGPGGIARSRIARLFYDGTVDSGFDPGMPGTVNTIVVQPDGKILVGLALNGSGNHLRRLNADGTADNSFIAVVDNAVNAIAVQTDGRILIAGNFTSINNFPRTHVARLNVDGTIDTSFNSGTNGSILGLALQPDGRVLLGGNFTRVSFGLGDVQRNFLARLNSDGTVDTSFDPGASAAVSTVRLEPDGTILVGGPFLFLGGGTGTVSRSHLGRLNADGSVDSTFDPGANLAIYSFALQQDGAVIVGGDLSSLGGGGMGANTRLRIGRLTSATSPGLLLNLSTRADVLTGEDVAIAGFVVSGTDAKTVLIRGLGPTLATLNVTNPLPNPTLTLFTGSLALATNSNWKDTQEVAIAATGKAPPDNREPAILRTLAPGSYTAVLSGQNNTTGVGLVEVYDLDASGSAFMSNISTRAFVGTGDSVLIGGFVSATGSVKVLVRALGPTLRQFNVSGVLADPTLGIFDANGTQIGASDNWEDAQRSEIQATGIAPPNALEPAVIITRPPSSTTAIVRGKNDSTGVALVEIYEIP